MTTLASRRATSPRPSRRDQLWVDLPFTKAPAASSGTKGDLELSGYASTWGLDRDEELVAPDAFDKSLSDYLAKNPMLLWQHNPDWPIGSLSTASTDDTGLYVQAIVPNPGPDAADWQKGAYTAIKNGIVRTFSIGGYFTRDVKQGPDGPLFYIVEIDLFEVSCVSIPANADSLFEAAAKALSGESAVRMSEKASAQMEQLLGFRDMTDPELRGMDEDQRAERYGALAAIFEEVHGSSPPGYEDFRRIESAREGGVDSLRVAAAASMLVKSFYMPEDGEKAGRAISAANREKLEGALAEHDGLQEKMIDAATAMQAAADHHANATSAIKDVLGISDEEEAPPPDPDGDDEEDEGSPEKAIKQLTYDLFSRFAEAGTERFAADVSDDEYCYVYVDDFDLDQGFVVYCVSTGSGRTYYQVAFTRDGEGGVVLAAGQAEVSPTTGYVPKSAATEAARTGVPGEPREGAGSGKGYSPQAYERDEDETVECPHCNLFNDPDASYCDQCGFLLDQRTDVGGTDGSHDGEPYEPAAYRRDAGEDVRCPECQSYNDLDASYCDQCGFHLAGAEGVTSGAAGETLTEASSTKGALSAPSGAFAPRATAWSGSAADKRIRTWAGAEEKPNAKYARAFLYCEGGDSSEKFGDYKYGVADVVDGEFKLIFKGVSAAASRAQQQGLDAIYPALRSLYSRAAKQFDDDSIESPV